jgi:PKD domain-containing protein
MRKRVAGVATTICMVLGLPAAAGAVPTWSVASPVSEGGVSIADTAMGPNGDAAMTWVGFVGGTLTAQVATRSPSGSVSVPLDLSPPGNESSNASRVAEDAAGEATVVWNSSVEKSNYIMEAATVKGGILSAPAKLSAPGQNAISPALAVDERGDAIIAWTRNNGADEIVQASFRPAGGVFGAPVNLSAASGNAAPTSPRVAIDAAGDATVVWEWSNGGAEVIQEATRPAATGSFTPPATLSNPAESSIQPSVAMNAEGDTVVGWVWAHSGANTVAQATVRPAGGKFSEPASLSASAAGCNADHPQVALDGSGGSTVVWACTIGGFESVVEYSNGTLAGTFSPTMGLAFEAWFPSIAEDAAGDTLVGYATFRADGAAAAFRPAGGAFGADQEISSAGQFVDSEGGLKVAMSGDGDGAFGFIAEESGGEFIPRMSLLDTVGVELEKVSIPTTATAGVPVTFSAQPRDRAFSAPTVSWAFGDASSASGSSVTHTFTNPGTYSVSVTADAAPGDSVTHTGTIIVVAPVLPAVSAFHAATLGTSTVSADNHGRVHLKVACPVGGAACAGTATLTLPATASGLAVAARVRGTPVTVAAGDASFSVAAGASMTMSVALPTPVLQLLKRHHHLTLTFALESHNASGPSATTSGEVLVKAYVKPKKAKGKKKK